MVEMGCASDASQVVALWFTQAGSYWELKDDKQVSVPCGAGILD